MAGTPVTGRVTSLAVPTTTALALLALGVVYGDIGTSPLYALQVCFTGSHSIAVSPENVLGILSLIFWALIIVVTLKYHVFVLHADNEGEGGILALMALVHPEQNVTGRRRRRRILVLLGLFGAALLYGDGMITPAISVLSAIEGLHVATPVFDPYVIPITIVILLVLFAFQRHGTAGIGRIFGPTMLVWFACIGLLGLREIFLAPQVLTALDPRQAIGFLSRNQWPGLLVLGGVFLVTTGGEALYADMGHFSERSIQVGWFCVALPALLLNYFGQGALLLGEPTAVANPFFLMTPAWALYPMVVIATAATVIASQAIISGAYSLTMQAMNLGYSPRLKIEHTSAKMRGQIYIPTINWVLAAATMALVIAFKSSNSLAGAYGVAVSTTMLITTILMWFVTRDLWGWVLPASITVVGAFLIVDITFFAANLAKIFEGGWFPLVVGAAAFALMTTWWRGRRVLSERMAEVKVPLRQFVEASMASNLPRVPGTAVYLTGDPAAAPPALVRLYEHTKVLHQNVIILHVKVEESPHVSRLERFNIEEVGPGFYRLVARYGFMEEPNVLVLLDMAVRQGLPIDLKDRTFFLGRERIIAAKRPGGMALWREKLFAIMARNAEQATAFFHLPPEEVVEVGAQVRL
ncbi:MAG: potassium transporter Kup [Thermoplasmatota archaeon]